MTSKELQSFIKKIQTIGNDQLLHTFSEAYVEFSNYLKGMEISKADELRTEVMLMRDELRNRLRVCS